MEQARVAASGRVANLLGAARRRTDALLSSPWSLGLLALWFAAFLVRGLSIGAQAYGDEAAHYYVSRSWGAEPEEVFPGWPFGSWLWLQRPLFSLLLWPGAVAGFTGYRLWHIAIASTLPVLVAALARRAGAAPWIALGAGSAAAFHPLMVRYGILVFPDTLLAVLALAGLYAYVSTPSRPGLAAALLLAATWVKEVGGLLLLAVLVHAGHRAWRKKDLALYPLRLDRRTTAFLAACLLAPLPLMLGILAFGGRMPGWSDNTLDVGGFLAFFLTAFMLIPIATGLLWAKTRAWSLVGLLYPAFYAAYSWRGGGVEAWYAILPAALALVAAAAGLQAIAQRRRRLGQACALLCGIAVLVVAAVPTEVAWRGVATPAAQPPQSLVEQARGFAREHDFDDAVAALPASQADRVFTVDVGWFYIAYPMSMRAGAVGYGYSEFASDLDPWIRALEVDSNITFLEVHDELPLNRAIRSTYGDCLVYQNPRYMLLDSDGCAGRGDALASALQTEAARP